MERERNRKNGKFVEWDRFLERADRVGRLYASSTCLCSMRLFQNVTNQNRSRCANYSTQFEVLNLRGLFSETVSERSLRLLKTAEGGTAP